jgi:WD40 repeat protein
MQPRSILLIAFGVFLSQLIIGGGQASGQTPGKRPQLVAQLGHPLGLTGRALSPDGQLLVTGGDDGSAIVWDVATEKELRRLKGHISPV